MNRIRDAIIILSAITTLLLFDIFFSGLIQPFNAIEIIQIAILLIFLEFSLEHACIASIILGGLEDYSALQYLGLQTVIYLIALFILAFVRGAIITDENKITILISGILFFTTVIISQMLLKWSINYEAVFEILFGITINSALAVSGYFIIEKIHKEIDKRFL